MDFYLMPEPELILYLKSRIIRFLSYSKMKVHNKSHRRNSKSLFKSRRPQNLASATCLFSFERTKKSFMNVSPSSNMKAKTILIESPVEYRICNIKIDPGEVYECIQGWFKDLYLRLSLIGGSKIKNKENVIHLSNVKQFFLNAGIVSRKAFGKVNRVLKGAWVSYQEVVSAVECLKLAVKRRPMRNAGWHIRKNVMELVFFFRIFQGVEENSLNYGEIEKILRIAMRNCPDLLPSSTLHDLFKVSKSSLVTFQEFFKFIISYL